MFGEGLTKKENYDFVDMSAFGGAKVDKPRTSFEFHGKCTLGQEQEKYILRAEDIAWTVEYLATLWRVFQAETGVIITGERAPSGDIAETVDRWLEKLYDEKYHLPKDTDESSYRTNTRDALIGFFTSGTPNHRARWQTPRNLSIVPLWMVLTLCRTLHIVGDLWEWPVHEPGSVYDGVGREFYDLYLGTSKSPLSQRPSFEVGADDELGPAILTCEVLHKFNEIERGYGEWQYKHTDGKYDKGFYDLLRDIKNPSDPTNTSTSFTQEYLKSHFRNSLIKTRNISARSDNASTIERQNDPLDADAKFAPVLSVCLFDPPFDSNFKNPRRVPLSAGLDFLRVSKNFIDSIKSVVIQSSYENRVITRPNFGDSLDFSYLSPSRYSFACRPQDATNTFHQNMVTSYLLPVSGAGGSPEKKESSSSSRSFTSTRITCAARAGTSSGTKPTLSYERHDQWRPSTGTTTYEIGNFNSDFYHRSRYRYKQIKKIKTEQYSTLNGSVKLLFRPVFPHVAQKLKFNKITVRFAYTVSIEETASASGINGNNEKKIYMSRAQYLHPDLAKDFPEIPLVYEDPKDCGFSFHVTPKSVSEGKEPVPLSDFSVDDQWNSIYFSSSNSAVPFAPGFHAYRAKRILFGSKNIDFRFEGGLTSAGGFEQGQEVDTAGNNPAGYAVLVFTANAAAFNPKDLVDELLDKYGLSESPQSPKSVGLSFDGQCDFWTRTVKFNFSVGASDLDASTLNLDMYNEDYPDAESQREYPLEEGFGFYGPNESMQFAISACQIDFDIPATSA